MKRIVITGIGSVCSAGCGVESLWTALMEGSRTAALPSFNDTANPGSLVHEVEEIESKDVTYRKRVHAGERGMRMAVTAAHLALKDGVLDPDSVAPERVGVVYGSTLDSLRALSEFHRRIMQEGPRCADPGLFPNTGMSAASCQVSIAIGFRAFNATLSNGATAGLDAILYAINMLQAERADFVLAGGMYALSSESLTGFQLSGALAGGIDGLCKPFDRTRSGMVLGEGSATLLLETYESALARGATPLAEVKGGASAFDPLSEPGYDLRGQGASDAMQDALDRSDVRPKEIDLVVANASGDQAADCMESRALIKTFGRSKLPYITAPKATIGDCLSASGVFQAAVAALAISRSSVPPTMNFKTPGNGCRISPVTEPLNDLTIRNAMINSHSPSGANTTLVLAAL